jgi:FkbH-like protein
MKFAEALKLLKDEPPSDARPLTIALACGTTANTLQVFLSAHLRTLLPDRRVNVRPGLYGDCLGNLDRCRQSPLDGTAVVLEWADLDPRLGLRHAGGWPPSALPDVLAGVDAQAERFRNAVVRAAAHAPVVMCLPTLPLPPLGFAPGGLLSEFEAGLQARIAGLAAELTAQPGVRLVSPQRLDQLSPPGERLDVRGDLLSGFPYRTAHASALAGQLAGLLHLTPPKKGIITDLDDTLWRGLLGEAGEAGVSWGLDRQSHGHALYQQLLQSLADAGALVAVASKNDPARVEAAFRREDLLLNPQSIFPVEAHWGPKSESVRRILRAWNVGADGVVFVDDSPLELAEVRAAHPGIETFLFPRDNDQAIYDLLWGLRDLFGRPALREEDGLRLESLRRAAEADAASEEEADRDSFLKGVEAQLVFHEGGAVPDPRALELVNKTNQFNLNGRRFTEGEWLARRQRPGSFLYLVSYRDKFGPLGKIAEFGGRREGTTLRVDVWVMSCRAFSRRIEYQCVEFLFERFAVEEIAFEFEATARNGPLQEFFAGVLGEAPSGPVRLLRDEFTGKRPPLFHKVEVEAHG